MVPYKYSSNRDVCIIVGIRHAECIGNLLDSDNAARRKEPNHLFELTLKGVRQAKKASKTLTKLGFHKFDGVYASTYLRSPETLRHMGFTDFVEDSRIRERESGIYHHMSRRDIGLLYPDQEVSNERNGWYHNRPIGGESGPDVEMRNRSFMTEVGMRHLGKAVLFCGHGNQMLFLEKIALNLRYQEVEQLHSQGPTPNCAITIYEFRPHFELRILLNKYAPGSNKKSDTRHA